MKKFEIKFTHTAQMTYTAIVEAEDSIEAEALWLEDPFKYVKDLNEVENEIDIGNEIDTLEEVKP